MIRTKPLGLFVAAWLAWVPLGGFCQDVATVISVDPGATLVRAQAQVRLAAGAGVASGDVITTDRRGQVQLLFGDETRVAIGPNARFVVENVVLNSKGRARTFAVSAVAGSFRFLTGKSRKSAYAIDTPTATMGIRGTVFDFVVHDTSGTDLILFSGQVRMCGRGGQCYRVVGGCAAVAMDRGGTLSAVGAGGNRRSLIADGFSFVTDQSQLQPEFRTEVGSCGRDVARPPQRIERGDHAPPQPSPPAPPEPPGPPEPPDPPVI